MKVYTKIVIDLSTGKTLNEESFEYNGLVSHCGGSSGPDYVVGDASTEAQADIFEELKPLAELMSERGQRGLPAYQVPGAPRAPDIAGSVDPYNIPSPDLMMPTQNWWNSLSPEVMSGLEAPWMAARDRLTEDFSARGSIGSPRGGYSGAAGAAMGELAGQAAQNIGMQAWQMSQPAMARTWEEVLNRDKGAYALEVGRMSDDYDMSRQVWGANLEANRMPFAAMPGMLGGSYGEPVISQAPLSSRDRLLNMWQQSSASSLQGSSSGFQSGGNIGGIVGGIGGGVSGLMGGYQSNQRW